MRPVGDPPRGRRASQIARSSIRFASKNWWDGLADLGRRSSLGGGQAVIGKIHRLARIGRGDRAENRAMRSILMALVITPMIALAGDRQSFEGLVADLEAADPETGLSAVQKLAEGGDARAVPLLIAALQRDMKARTGLLMAIIPALGELGDPSAVPILLLALNNRDDHWIAREAAAQALGAIGAPEAVPDLIKAAWMVDTREAAITALAQIADERAVEVLVTALDPAEDAGVREQALAGLIHIGRPAVPALTAVVAEGSGEYPNTAQRALAAYALGKIGDPRAHAALEQAAQDPSAEVRASASKALGRLQ